MEIQLISNDELYHFNPYHDTLGRFASKHGNLLNDRQLSKVMWEPKKMQKELNRQDREMIRGKYLLAKGENKKFRKEHYIDIGKKMRDNSKTNIDTLLYEADRLGFKVTKNDTVRHAQRYRTLVNSIMFGIGDGLLISAIQNYRENRKGFSPYREGTKYTVEKDPTKKPWYEKSQYDQAKDHGMFDTAFVETTQNDNYTDKQALAEYKKYLKDPYKYMQEH